MSRYSHPAAVNPEPTLEGDSYFDRVNEKEDRSTLPVGTLAKSVNKRLRKKNAETRRGIFPPVFANILDLEVIRGWGVYSNPNGEEVFFVAGDTEIYKMKDGSAPITYSVDSAMADSVEFVQAHNEIIVFQGEDTVQLAWDGVSPSGFRRITKSNPSDTSTLIIPPATTAEHVTDRLFIIKNADEIIATDIGDYTSYDEATELFYVNRGASDANVRVLGYVQGTVLLFKSRSVYALYNYGADPSQAVIQLLNSHLGLAGRKAVVMVGGDVLFLSEPGGIYKVAQSFESRIDVVPVPITDCIQPLIDRINWPAANGAVAIILGEYVKFFVPIDGATRNNCAIIYNAATGLIEGYDTWSDPLRIDDAIVTFYQGEKRIYALDKEAAKIYVLDEGNSDFIYAEGEDEATEHQIEDVCETRGYATLGWNAATRRDFKRVELGLATWAPSITITELTESANDERALNSNAITKSRTRYDIFGKNDWVSTNVNDDWGNNGRQDYSITANTVGFDPGSGIDPDREQIGSLRFSTKARGKYISYRIENSQGRARLCWVLAESTGLQREPRRAG